MKTKQTKVERFKNIGDFGSSLGLSPIEMQLIRQKKLLITRLKEARNKRGLSQAEVAHAVGSKQPAIARMEAGQVSQVSMDFLFKVALSLEVVVRFPASETKKSPQKKVA